MKNTRPLIIFSFFLSMTSFAQTVAPMGGAPDDILFLGFNNVFTVNDEMGKNRIFNVTLNGGEVKTLRANDGSTSHGRYILFPDGSNKNPELIITDNEGVEMTKKSFKVSRIPDTDVQFATPDGKFSMSERKLVPHNDAFAYFEKILEVQGWQLEIEGIIVAEGRGNSLDDEAMNRISDLATGTDFIVVAMLVDDAGIIRKKTISCLKD